MSVHKSLKTKGRLERRRNVLTRIERLEKLNRDGRWSEDESPFALPAVKVIRPKKRVKKDKKKAEETAAEGEAAATTEGAPKEEAAGKGAAAKGKDKKAKKGK